MSLTESTLARINNLANGIVETTENDNVVLKVMVSSTSTSEDTPGWLVFNKKEAQLYYKALSSLEADTALEHLSRADLDRELLILVRDVRDIKRAGHNNSEIKSRIANFESELAQPLMMYEVALSVEGINFPVEPLAFGNVVFQEFSPDLEEQWGLKNSVGSNLIKEWDCKRASRAVGIVTVKAGSDEKAKERAVRSLDRALHILRVCIASSVYARIWDEQLLQRRGPFSIIRKIDPDEHLLEVGWKAMVGRLNTAFDLEGSLADGTRTFLARLNPIYDDTITQGLGEPLLRCLEWIGISITREQYDHKIIDLCIALESVITTKDNTGKGEAIALRLMLLSMSIDASFYHPMEVLHLYDLRSRVVHGAAQGICSRSDYFMLRQIAEEAALHIIELNHKQGPITKPSRLIRKLETPDLLEKAINWLEMWQDDPTKELAEYARERLDRH